MKVMVAIPCGATMPVEFVSSLIGLVSQKQMLKDKYDVEIEVVFHTGSLVYEARNRLVKIAKDYKADFILWLDSDMVFVPEILLQLMDEMGKCNADILSGVYFKRTPPFTPAVYVRKDDGLYYAVAEFPEQPFEVDGMGFGCVLMKTDVLNYLDEEPFYPINGVGEDFAFCQRCKEAGFPLVATSRVMPGHVSSFVVNKGAYDNAKRSSNIQN